MGVELMGSNSEELDAAVRGEAKKSMVGVRGVWVGTWKV